MDRSENPFAPGAGSRPPELVGRDKILEDIRILLRRVKRKRSEQSIILTGLRGVGKTVLLVRAKELAQQEGYRAIPLEAHEDKSLAALIAPDLRALLLELDRLEGAKDKVRHGLAVIRNFMGAVKISIADTITFELDSESAPGTADSGDIEIDLPKVLVAIGAAAQDRKIGIAIIIDELQYLKPKELGALIMSMHRVQQEELPVVLIGAGLPSLPGLMGQSKSYAERLFSFPEIGALSQGDSAKAIQDPAEAEGVAFQDAALDAIFRHTEGYPYFLQEWGYHAWNLAPSSPITQDVIRDATAIAEARLDQNFFHVRFERLTPKEKQFLRAMAELGPGVHRTGDMAAKMGVKTSDLSTRRDKLIQKGMIYSPAYGEIAFTVPLFDQFMKRAMLD